MQSKEKNEDMEFPEVSKPKEISPRMKTIKVDVMTWDTLKNIKEDGTFNDAIKYLLKEGSKSIGGDNIKAIAYSRKTIFFTSKDFGENIGYEFDYNDVKRNKQDFVLDLKMKKIFFGKKSLSPSEFFGLDNVHKHYSSFFLLVYLKAVALILEKEFRIYAPAHYTQEKLDYENIALWRKTYHEYSLSEESFIEDIEGPMSLSEKEKPSSTWKNKVISSPSHQLQEDYKQQQRYKSGVF